MAKRAARRLSLELVASAGAAAFTEAGYRLTQVAHVAERLQVSVGAIYRYVDSKDALFEVSALFAAGRLEPVGPSPRTAEGNAAFEDHMRAFFAEHARWPVLDTAKAMGGGDPGEIAAELFDLLSRWAVLVRLLERCARDRPDLMRLFEDGLRTPYMADLTRWAYGRRGEGRARPDALARGAMEAVSWLAIRRPHDASGQSISDTDARAAAIALVRGAF